MLPVFEIMLCNQAIRNLIREGKTHQMQNTITANRASGMIAMDDAIIEAYKQDKITKETAIMYASDARYVASKM